LCRPDEPPCMRKAVCIQTKRAVDGERTRKRGTAVRKRAHPDHDSVPPGQIIEPTRECPLKEMPESIMIGVSSHSSSFHRLRPGRGGGNPRGPYWLMRAKQKQTGIGPAGKGKKRSPHSFFRVDHGFSSSVLLSPHLSLSLCLSVYLFVSRAPSIVG
jgi:hypothetical protein